MNKLERHHYVLIFSILTLIASVSPFVAGCGGGGGTPAAETTTTTTTTSTTTSTTAGTSGTLDTSFNSQGYVTANNVSGGNSTDEANDMIIDGSGNILVVGSSAKSNNTLTLVLLRYNSSGQLDTTFSSDGLAATEGDTSTGTEVGNSLVLASDNKIWVTGYSQSLTNVSSLELWRFTATGSLDATFSGDGHAPLPNGHSGNVTSGSDIIRDSNNKIIVSGYEDDASDVLYSTFFRSNSTGSIDATFNGTGYIEWGTGSFSLAVLALALGSSNKIIGTGFVDNQGDDDMYLFRLTSAGALDSTFSNDGDLADHSAAGGNSHDRGLAVAMESSGNILVTGYSKGTTLYDMTIWRYSSSGSADTTFHNDGAATYEAAGNSVGQALAIDSSGRILVAGFVVNTAGNADLAVWRYNSNGTIDTTFGANGIFTHDGAGGSSNSDDQGTAIAIDSNGKIIVAGISSHPTQKNNIVVWRLNP